MINKLKDIKESLCYDDVLLLPQYSTIKSRFTDVDLGVTLDKKRGITLKLPIISSPMDTITEDVMAITLADAGGLGIIHRYNTIEKQVSLLTNVLADNKDRLVACAIGISGDYLERAEKLVKAGCRILCLDVAHGHCEQMKTALETLRPLYPDVHLMAGNIATDQGGVDLMCWGANSIRCGVGSGCFTPNMKVNTKEGFKNIGNIKVGDYVYSHTGNIKKVIDLIKYSSIETLYFIDGIECTNNHEFYVINKIDKDKVNEENIHEYAKWVRAEHLDKDKHLLIELE